MNTIFFWDYVSDVTVNYHSGGAVVIIDVDLEHARERWRKYVGESSDYDPDFEKAPDPKALDELPDRSFKIDAPPLVLVYGDSGVLLMDEYQRVTRSTAIYPDALTGSIHSLTYLALGLGETGEVQGKIKKVLRDNGGVATPEARDAIAEELGDVLWYVARLADELGYDLNVVAEMNLSKLRDRQDRGVLTGSGDNR